eukprot:gnl/MRDRNA2_/MRDRNA2_133682_c0_seq1.p1 gnl/MRDRNA2_/MRDRNA2_133682_c0~~gnl/MRDRNA2_/MRDRNA2_133682_c0_seq1.p1  ORF type:complete len:565 (+),score=83.23 gnl/MRDRNA2_/MRDRNA2_133682_c0_seq1:41-1696(+)
MNDTQGIRSIRNVVETDSARALQSTQKMPSTDSIEEQADCSVSKSETMKTTELTEAAIEPATSAPSLTLEARKTESTGSAGQQAILTPAEAGSDGSDLMEAAAESSVAISMENVGNETQSSDRAADKPMLADAAHAQTTSESKFSIASVTNTQTTSSREAKARKTTKALESPGDAPSQLKKGRRMKIMRDVLLQYGYTEGCAGCNAAKAGAIARAHRPDCRERIEGQMKAEAAASTPTRQVGKSRTPKDNAVDPVSSEKADSKHSLLVQATFAPAGQARKRTDSQESAVDLGASASAGHAMKWTDSQESAVDLGASASAAHAHADAAASAHTGQVRKSMDCTVEPGGVSSTAVALERTEPVNSTLEQLALERTESINSTLEQLNSAPTGQAGKRKRTNSAESPIDLRASASTARVRKKIKRRKQGALQPKFLELRRSQRSRQAPSPIYDPLHHSNSSKKMSWKGEKSQFDVGDIVWTFGVWSRSPWPGKVTAVIAPRTNGKAEYHVSSFKAEDPLALSVSHAQLVPWPSSESGDLVAAVFQANAYKLAKNN